MFDFDAFPYNSKNSEQSPFTFFGVYMCYVVKMFLGDVPMKMVKVWAFK